MLVQYELNLKLYLQPSTTTTFLLEKFLAAARTLDLIEEDSILKNCYEKTKNFNFFRL